MRLGYANSLDEVKSIRQLCRLVEKSVGDNLGLINEDVTVHFGELHDDAIGAFYHPYSNRIVVNTNPLKGVSRHRPELVKEYLFYILLHEYIHSLGIYSEDRTQRLTAIVSNHLFGRNHPVTRLAAGQLNTFRQRPHQVLIIARRYYMFFTPGFW
jgi:hypothetical protein